MKTPISRNTLNEPQVPDRFDMPALDEGSAAAVKVPLTKPSAGGNYERPTITGTVKG